MFEQYYPDELQHYGVLGMKWGVRRAGVKAARNERLARRASKYDIKSYNANKKSEKIHAELDLGRANKAAKKAAKYAVKATKLTTKANNTNSEYAKSKLERRAAKANFKSSIKKQEANKISKLTGYGNKAMKYSVKSDKFAVKAAKARYKIANNKRYIAKMNQKISSVSEKEISRGREFVDAQR